MGWVSADHTRCDASLLALRTRSKLHGAEEIGLQSLAST